MGDRRQWSLDDFSEQRPFANYMMALPSSAAPIQPPPSAQVTMSTSWSPSSWREKPIAQDVIYENQEDLEK